MKPMTILLLACGFAAGLLFGVSGPFAKVGDGLARILSETHPQAGRAARITAAVDFPRDGFQAADFRWNARNEGGHSVVCTPKDDLGRAALPGIQHL